jgi:hypothetical protein
MTIAEVASGTQSATVGTEHSLATSTTGKTYVFVVNAVNMVNGDELELRVKTKVLSGSTAQLAYLAAYAHVQTTPNKYSVPIPANRSCEVTLKQTAGTSRNFEWALLSID